MARTSARQRERAKASKKVSPAEAQKRARQITQQARARAKKDCASEERELAQQESEEAQERAKEKRKEKRQQRVLNEKRRKRFPPLDGVDSDDGDSTTDTLDENLDTGGLSQEEVWKNKLELMRRNMLKVQKELNEEKNKNKKTVPDAITTTVRTADTPLTAVSVDPVQVSVQVQVPVPVPVPNIKKMTVAQQRACLDGKEVREDVREKLDSFVTRQIFKTAKFAMNEATERKVCVRAVEKRKVILPGGVTTEVFAVHCSGLVRKRMNKLRSNIHSSCKFKFDCKCVLLFAVIIR